MYVALVTPNRIRAGLTTFVEVPTGGGEPGVVAYTVSGQKVCPECEKVAKVYFTTGVLSENSCKTCGTTFVAGRGEFTNEP